MRTRLRRIPIAMGLAITVMAACGNTGQPEKAPIAAAGPTKADYIRQGDAICAEIAERLKAIPDQENVTPEQAARLSEAYLNAVKPGYERFKGLSPPAADKATADQLNAYLDGILIRINEGIAAAKSRKGGPYDKAQEERQIEQAQFGQLAKSYGFSTCGSVDGTQ